MVGEKGICCDCGLLLSKDHEFDRCVSCQIIFNREG